MENVAESESRQYHSNGNSQLRALPRELYLSKFIPHITSEDIVHYMRKNSVDNMLNTRVIRLIKKDQDVSLLSFVSFKIETDHTAALLQQPDFWPFSCSISNFVGKAHKTKKMNLCTTLSSHPSSAVVSIDNDSGNYSGNDSDLCCARDQGHFLMQPALHQQAK